MLSKIKGVQSSVFESYLNKIQTKVEQHSPIKMILPAFPAKSPNRNKTYSIIPDMADFLGLQCLQELCDTIENIYPLGAEIIICSDGHVFSDLVKVEDNQVTEYGCLLKEMISDNRFLGLTCFNLGDALPELSYSEMRHELTHSYGQNIDDIRASVKNSAMDRNLFSGIHRFIFEDLCYLMPNNSKTKNRNLAKGIAYQVIQRSHAWSGLVESHFLDALRLSIHPQTIETGKISLPLVHCQDMWGTPWHNVALFDGDYFRLIHQYKAHELGARLKWHS